VNAPLIWAGLPVLFGVVVWLLKKYPRIQLLAGCGLFVLFALLAIFLPIENPVGTQRAGFIINSSMNILGRQFVLTFAEQPMLMLLFGFSAFWMLGLFSISQARRLVSYGLVILGLLTASLMVQPFLYAALIIEAAVLISVPLLAEPAAHNSRGLVRFIIFLSLAVPFTLLAGWAANLAEANPANGMFQIRAAILLALGFSFMLGVFPLFTWMPMLSEETHPFISGFLLNLLSVVILFLGVRFLNTYGWLRTMAGVPNALQIAGGFMIISAGLWAGFDRKLIRLPAYLNVFQNGLALVALSLRGASPLILFSALLIPRLIMTGYLCLALSVLERKQVLGKVAFAAQPFAAVMVLVSIFSMSGFPLLAGFPSMLLLIERLGQQAPAILLLVALGLIALIGAGIRHMISMVTPAAEPDTQSLFTEPASSVLLNIYFTAGILVCLIIGLFPSRFMLAAEEIVRAFQNWQ
jgi:formate hydrogenlyase subunit 3/multisubunit Na+/H+ antiporter MnhD subunit